MITSLVYMFITIKRFGGYKDGRLQRFGNKVKKGLPLTLKEVAVNVRNNAKNIVAVKTGRLQRSIRVMNVSSHSVEVRTAVPYAGFVEFGTINQAAQPYLRPAIAMTAKLVGKKINIRLVNAWQAS